MFLVTTALEKFWNFEGPILFLGDWCCRYDRRHLWESLNAKIIPDPWMDRMQYINDYYYVKSIYERVLYSLSEALNALHRIDCSYHYWRIIIGPWLFWYITAVQKFYSGNVPLSMALFKRCYKNDH